MSRHPHGPLDETRNMKQSSTSYWDPKCLPGGAALALAAGPRVDRMSLQLSLVSEQRARAAGGSGSLAGSWQRVSGQGGL